MAWGLGAVLCKADGCLSKKGALVGVYHRYCSVWGRPTCSGPELCGDLVIPCVDSTKSAVVLEDLLACIGVPY